METDYDRYSVEFLCNNQAGNFCTDPEARILSRSKTLRKHLMERDTERIKELCVDRTIFTPITIRTGNFP